MNSPHAKTKRRQGGVATSDLVFSASRLPDAEALPDILSLHAPDALPLAYVGDRRSDLLKYVDPRRALTEATPDVLQHGGRLQAGDGTLGVIILDPPRASPPTPERDEPAHDELIKLYRAAGDEALRALRRGGVLVAKCRDEVSDGRLTLTHVEVVNALAGAGLYAKDIHVMLEPAGGDPPRPQRVAHVGHAYFLVFQKKR